MNLSEVLSELESLGTEQNRKVYRRHGVVGEQSGLSFSNLNNLAKRYKHADELARQLWESGNHDARMLAIKIANPAQLTADSIDAWVEDLDNCIITDAFSHLVGKTSFARQKMEEWIGREDEWPATAGWNLLTLLAMGNHGLPDDFFDPYLETIQRTIHTRKNRVRYAMNNALFAIGIRNYNLEQKALAAANRWAKCMSTITRPTARRPSPRSTSVRRGHVGIRELKWAK
jgi:3-methyladenine DNA glycosylase AlkD